MKITDVKITAFKRPPAGNDSEAMIKGQSIMAWLTDFVAVQIQTDEGVTGETFSFGGGVGLAHYLAGTMKPVLIGRDPADREAIWQELWSLNRLWMTPTFALGTIDVALWDLYGKSIGQPIYKILGAYRDKLPAYASSMTKPTTEAFVEEAIKYKERNFHGYKLHVLGDPDKDIAACTAVRKAVGDDFKLMVDVVSAYNHTQALRVGRALEELGFHWYEEPLRDYDIHGYKKLADKLDIPIAGVEVNEGAMFTTPEYITTGAIDIVRSDVSFKGGIGPVKKTAALAEAFGMNIEIHTNCNPYLDAANLHVSASIKNTEFFEQLVPEGLFNFGVKEFVHIDKEGYAHVPQGPGVGMEIDWDYVNRYKTVVL